MKNFSIIFSSIFLLILVHSSATAHKQVVVVPLGGGGYAQQNPLMIPAADFREDGVVPGSAQFSFSTGSIVGTGDNYGCIVAPAYLPDKVTVTELSAMVVDDDATFDIDVTLYRASTEIPAGTSMLANVTTTGSQTHEQIITTSSISDSVVDSESYTYYVTTCLLSGDLQLDNVKVHYAK